MSFNFICLDLTSEEMREYFKEEVIEYIVNILIDPLLSNTSEEYRIGLAQRFEQKTLGELCEIRTCLDLGVRLSELTQIDSREYLARRLVCYYLEGIDDEMLRIRLFRCLYSELVNKPKRQLKRLLEEAGAYRGRRHC